jgi:hypothetical protein
MLRVFDFDKKSVGAFEDYDAFLEFITGLENQKLLEAHPSFGRGYWAFAYYSPEKLKDVCAWIKPGYLTTIQAKALEQKLGLIEICRGDPVALQEVPVTPELDVEEFKKKFCLGYCRQCGWRLIETLDHKPLPNNWLKKRRYIAHPYTRKNRLSQRSLDTTRGRRLKADLDCCIERLRQQPVAEKSSTTTQNNDRKGNF